MTMHICNCAAASALMIMAAAPSSTIHAADLGSNCCADVEERIAELEATTARKGTRKVSLTLTGYINRAVLFWDDGFESNAYSVGNKNDQTNISFEGEALISRGWKAGYDITIRIEDNLSDSVDQNTANAGDGFQIWKAYWFIENDTYGRLAVGRESRVSDTAPETDFSETAVAAYAGVQDIGGGFLLRRRNGDLSDLTWGDLGNHFNGDTIDLIRWDSPEFAGFIVSASWGADDIWDVGLRHSGEGGGFKYEGVIAYTKVTDAPSDVAGVDQSTVVGSASMIHESTGFNATVAAGYRTFDATALDANGVERTPADAKFVYAKIAGLQSPSPRSARRRSMASTAASTILSPSSRIPTSSPRSEALLAPS